MERSTKQFDAIPGFEVHYNQPAQETAITIVSIIAITHGVAARPMALRISAPEHSANDEGMAKDLNRPARIERGRVITNSLRVFLSAT
jgi:hypothetical protein